MEFNGQTVQLTDAFGLLSFNDLMPYIHRYIPSESLQVLVYHRFQQATPGFYAGWSQAYEEVTLVSLSTSDKMQMRSTVRSTGWLKIWSRSQGALGSRP